ncbi:hypothetical protein Metho_1219 [Methanomethylovorans hollandica DSM 15978]|uniref:Uncharacterized protein n=1 Tax=Methanomethylovorans hollandica (strain DSM 15978 / NBRC 107637 / DMS1) TaxID=867904 RepID=L0KZN3_METHD|nr:hypothetical protein [Methanomethylovorans hollandica]AGB49449.1 hypothetical protein Metho_1219 [Methanomethylovorans hollandica DSM 15978]
MTNTDIPELPSDEVARKKGIIDRHHIASLPISVIEELDKNGYKRHEGKYYYIRYGDMIRIMQTCIDAEKNKN